MLYINVDHTVQEEARKQAISVECGTCYDECIHTDWSLDPGDGKV